MKRALPYGCIVVAAIAVIVLPPPAKLVALIGSDVWARLGLGVLVVVILFMLLIVLGLAAGKVGLPFGLSLEGGEPDGGPGAAGIAALAAELGALRQADERLFERIGAIGELLEHQDGRVTLLESRLLADDTAMTTDHDDG